VTVTYEELLSNISQESVFDKQILVSKDWLGHDILAGVIEVGEERPNIMITAGVHGDEPAGVIAAIKAAEALPVSANLYVLFCRDPAGYSSLEHIFSRMFEEDIKITNYNDLDMICANYGELIKLGDLRIGIFKNICLVFKPDFEKVSSAKIARNLDKALNEDKDLREKLDRMRVIIPSLSYRPGNPKIVSRAFYIVEGTVVDYDCLSDKIDLPESIALRSFIDKIRPVLVLDLHEGDHKGFCAVVSEKPSGVHKDVLEAVCKQVEIHGIGCTPLDKLENIELDYKLKIEQPIFHGAGVAKFNDRLVGYARKYGISILFSSERKRDFKDRVETHIVAVHSAVCTYATLHGL